MREELNLELLTVGNEDEAMLQEEAIVREGKGLEVAVLRLVEAVLLEAVDDGAGVWVVREVEAEAVEEVCLSLKGR